MISIQKVCNNDLLQKAFDLRIEVFVQEQNVPIEEEIDEFESSSEHFVAVEDTGKVVGACRWRITEKGCKLERFVVAKTARKKGVASQLIKAVMEDINSRPENSRKVKYLFAQQNVQPLYHNFGFVPYGDTFLECGIVHQAMKIEPSS